MFLALSHFGFNSMVVPFFLQWVFPFVPKIKAKIIIITTWII
jgi:hypothetical protein